MSFSDNELELARQFTEPLGIDVSKARKKARARTRRQPEPFAFEDEMALTKTVLSEEEKRASRWWRLLSCRPRLCRACH